MKRQMRRLLVAGAAAAAAVTGALAFNAARGPEELLPDLIQAKPAAISVIERGGQHRLVFLSAVENVGEGAIVIEGRRATRAEEAMAVEQIVSLSDGSTRSYAVEGELRYVSSETHAHWHLLGFERYELRRAGDGKLVAPDRKTGFCLGDRFDASPADLPNEPAQAVWTQECGLRSAGLLRVREGISPGYGDDYVPSLEGQYVVLDGVPAGRYRLVHRVNPERALHESDFSNNTASVLLELSWREGKPKVAVVG
jgi:Lysyl oxidase